MVEAPLYIGTKLIKALPMNRADYNTYRNWELPVDENGADEGFLVEYLDGGLSNHPDHKGYISWSPQEVFEKSYRKADSITFGLALEALKMGKRIARIGWNGKGMFIFIRPADELHIEMVVDKIKSLPQSVKDYYLQDILDEGGNRIPSNQVASDDMVKFTAYCCMKAADGTIINGWLATQTDMLADDWYILE